MACIVTEASHDSLLVAHDSQNSSRSVQSEDGYSYLLDALSFTNKALATRVGFTPPAALRIGMQLCHVYVTLNRVVDHDRCGSLMLISS